MGAALANAFIDILDNSIWSGKILKRTADKIKLKSFASNTSGSISSQIKPKV
jgi:hypothetical protein